MLSTAAESKVIIRSYQEDDAAAVASFFLDSHRLDSSIQDLTEASWRHFISLPFNRGARDFAVATRGGTLVGVLVAAITSSASRVDAIRHFRIVVHPAHRRQGIGSALLSRIEPENSGAAGRILQTNSPQEWEEGKRFLERRGFAAVEADFSMVRPELPLIRGPWPEGITLRRYAGPSDNAAWARINNLAYADTVSIVRHDASSLVPFTEDEGFGLWLAQEESTGEEIGFCHTFHEGGNEGVIESLAVLPSARGRGIGRALIEAAMETLMDAGRGMLTLNVTSNNAPALALYRSLGFEVAGSITRYWRLPSGAEGTGT